jgi:hypothetical protein
MKHAIGALAGANTNGQPRCTVRSARVRQRLAHSRWRPTALGESRPGDAARCATHALGFYRDVSATLYAEGIERLLAAASGTQQGAAG